MATTIRQYRLVVGMHRWEAVLECARIWSAWEGDPSLRPRSLVVYVQVDGDSAYQTYSYECPSFATALAIVEGVYDAKDSSTLVRVEWL